MDKINKITASWENEILKILISGQVIRQNAKDIAVDVFRISSENKPRLMLIDCRELEGRLGLTDTFGLVSKYPAERHTTDKTAVIENAVNSEIFTLKNISPQNL